jgi:hypothetical protein
VRRGGVLFVATIPSTGLAIAPIEPIASLAEAHCTTDAGLWYAGGYETLATSHNGVTGTIEWTQGNVCTGGVSHSVTLCATVDCFKWVQTGWRYYSNYAEPKMYCEYESGGSYYQIPEFPITHATHEFKLQKTGSGSNQMWSCYLDGTNKFSALTSQLGFSTGFLVVAQGETHQAHVQIGKMAPQKLNFSYLLRRRTSDSVWLGINLENPLTTFVPYGADEPLAGTLRVWTNAH